MVEMSPLSKDEFETFLTLKDNSMIGFSNQKSKKSLKIFHNALVGLVLILCLQPNVTNGLTGNSETGGSKVGGSDVSDSPELDVILRRLSDIYAKDVPTDALHNLCKFISSLITPEFLSLSYNSENTTIMINVSSVVKKLQDIPESTQERGYGDVYFYSTIFKP